ncbi:hypothetical protein LCGC14_1636210 [marine sediment metagenome]|uniref:Uncharacterized protein n=1 Tax=marine sediment metagenome TaxID=412755 RepID=A0A0F9I152_9ZZZZ
MALTVQNVVDDVSFELRKGLLDGTSGSGDDFNLIVRWIDQVQKDLLHTSIYRHALRNTEDVTSVAGTLSYLLTAIDIRRMEAVFDQKSLTFLSPIELLFPPSSLSDPPDLPRSARPVSTVADLRAGSLTPRFYRLSTVVSSGTNAHTLHLFPSPKAAENAGTVTVYYIKHVATVATAAAQIPSGEDMRDAMVAGVLARAYNYLYLDDKTAQWEAIYERRKRGETI